MMILYAPAAAPAAPSGASVPARTSGELGAVFSALVDALTEEFLPADESSSTPEEPLATEEALVEPGQGGSDAAAVIAVLLAGSAPAELAAESVPVVGIAGATVPAAGQLSPDATIPAPAPAAVVPDTDVAPGVGGNADGPVDTTATLEAAVEAGPIPLQTGGVEDNAAPIGLETVDATAEAGTLDPAPADDGADAPVEVLPAADQGEPADLSPVATDDAAAEPGDGDGDTVDRPEPGRTDAASIRPRAASPASEPNATAAITGSASSAPSAPVDAVGTAGAPARPTPAALPDQLLTVLAPLRRGPDGTHRVAIQLRPDELGEVQIDVQVRGNEIALSVRADLPGTVDLLRASVAELRAQLEAAGFQPGDLDVTGHGADGATDDQRRASDTDGLAAEHAAGSPTGADAAADAPPPPSSSSATGLDLRL